MTAGRRSEGDGIAPPAVVLTGLEGSRMEAIRMGSSRRRLVECILTAAEALPLFFFCSKEKEAEAAEANGECAPRLLLANG
jgi:hypothetical protein